jgi:hypothetical protein
MRYGEPLPSDRNNSSMDVNSLWHSPSVVTSNPSTIPRGGSANMETAFAEWSLIGQTANRLAEADAAGIWDSGSTSTASKWPTTYGSTATTMQSNFTESMAVGSGSRNNIQTRQEDAASNGASVVGVEGGIRARSSDLREVEVRAAQ